MRKGPGYTKPYFFLFRGHNITFISAFPADFHITGMEEIAPEGLVSYVRQFMSFDLVGSRMRGEIQISVQDIIRYGYEVRLKLRYRKRLQVPPILGAK